MLSAELMPSCSGSPPVQEPASMHTGSPRHSGAAPSTLSSPGPSTQASEAVATPSGPGCLVATTRQSSSQSQSESVSGCGPQDPVPEVDPFAFLREARQSISTLPSIFQRRAAADPLFEELSQQNVEIPDWASILKAKHCPGPRRLLSKESLLEKVSKVAKTKGQTTGRTYTSKYRGVHQTFPTKRWEAQFRRSGKPTSLGCFDEEEQAARAYDKMMLWCELHNSSGLKGGITNFATEEYVSEVPWLQKVSQEDLVQTLRLDGRRQAQQRLLRQKRDGQLSSFSGSLATDMVEDSS